MPSLRHITRHCLLLAVVAARLHAADAPATTVSRIADLGWLAGSWQGTWENGARFEAHYTDAGGGVILSASKELRNDRAVAFEFELFFERDGAIIYRPFPNGRQSAHDFLLIRLENDANGSRAAFENTEHDFPQHFVFARPNPDTLVITLSGLDKDGGRRQIRYELLRLR
jgi:hypothetical protein